MSESDRITNIIRAKFVLLQTLGIATSHSHKWSRDMFPEISLIVYCLEQFIIYILQNEKNVDALSEDIVKFFISCCETFRWDIVYQNCQRLLVQIIHLFIQCCLSFDKLPFQKMTHLCMKLLRIGETYLKDVYTWSAVTNRATFHLNGDCYETALGVNSEKSDMPFYSVIAECTLNQSWLRLYQVVLEKFQSIGREISQENLFNIICVIQKKLQTFDLHRNLTAKSQRKINEGGCNDLSLAFQNA